MSEVEQIILTACVTLAGGVILLALTELLKSFIVLPVQSIRKQVQIALGKVDFHCNRLTNFFPAEPDEHTRSIINTIQKELREAATELKSSYTMVPFKRALSALRLVPGPEEIDVAYRGLIYLHNSILYEGRREYVTNLIEMNHDHIDRINAALTHRVIPPTIGPKERG